MDAVEPTIRELLQHTPRMPVTAMAERIDWDRGLTILNERILELRPAYLPADPASRTVVAHDIVRFVRIDVSFRMGGLP